MSWFTALTAESLHDLFVHELKCLYDIESKQQDKMQKMIESATDPELKELLGRHFEQSRNQVLRLGTIFDRLGLDPEKDTSSAMRGLMADAETVIDMRGDPAVRDAALIAAAQCVEHLEIAKYGTVRTWASFIGHHDVADLLQQTLIEEMDFDKRLTTLAESSINQSATR
jgi:ferritin-like metal-binding protein YciE